MREHVCLIYILFDKNGVIDYVGRTSRKNMKRIYEHKSVLGFRPKYEVIDQCSTDCRNVEKKWIDHYRDLGFKLRNVNFGQGPHFCDEQTKLKLFLANRGKIYNPRQVTPGKRIRSTKRKATEARKKWDLLSKVEQDELIRLVELANKPVTDAERERRIKQKSERMSGSQKARWDSYSPLQRQDIADAMRRAAQTVPLEKRQESGRKRAETQWATWTVEQKLARAENISRTLKADPESRRKFGLMGVAAKLKKDPLYMEDMKAGVQRFWVELRKDPVRYREYCDNRGKSISVAKRAAFAAKRNIA